MQRCKERMRKLCSIPERITTFQSPLDELLLQRIKIARSFVHVHACNNLRTAEWRYHVGESSV
jgi:hypothetical protein